MKLNINAVKMFLIEFRCSIARRHIERSCMQQLLRYRGLRASWLVKVSNTSMDFGSQRCQAVEVLFRSGEEIVPKTTQFCVERSVERSNGSAMDWAVSLQTGERLVSDDHRG